MDENDRCTSGHRIHQLLKSLALSCLTACAASAPSEKGPDVGPHWRFVPINSSAPSVVDKNGAVVLWSSLDGTEQVRHLTYADTLFAQYSAEELVRIGVTPIRTESKSSSQFIVFNYVRARIQDVAKLGLAGDGHALIGVAIRVVFQIDDTGQLGSFANELELGLAAEKRGVRASVRLQTIGISPTESWNAQQLNMSTVRELIGKIAVLQNKIENAHVSLEPCILAIEEK